MKMVFMTLCLLVLMFNSVVTSTKVDIPSPLVFAGQINIGFLVDLHHSSSESGSPCQQINPNAVKKLVAAIWTMQMLNANRQSNDFTIGLHAYDTCGKEDIAVRQAVSLVDEVFLERKCNFYQKAQILAGMVNTLNNTKSVVDIFKNFQLPTILTSKLLDDKKDSIYSVLPSSDDLAEAVYEFLSSIDQSEISIVKGDSSPDIHSADRFLKESYIGNRKLKVTSYDKNEEFSPLKRDSLESVVLFMQPEEALTFLENSQENGEKLWIVASSMANDLSVRKSNNSNIVWIIPKAIKLQSYHKYFSRLMTDRGNNRLSFISEYLQEIGPVLSDFSDESGVFEVIKSIRAYFDALKTIVKTKCNNEPDLCLKYSNEVWHEEMKISLAKQRERAFTGVNVELGDTPVNFDDDGNMENSHFQYISFNGSERMILGAFSKQSGIYNLQLEKFQKLFKVDPVPRVFEIPSPKPQNLLPPSNLNLESNDTNPMHSKVRNFPEITSKSRPVRLSAWIKQPSVWAILIIGGLGLIFSLYVLVFVSVKLCDGTLSGNQSLGIIQLVAIVGMFSSAILHVVFKPTPRLCTCRHLLSSISCSFVLAVIVVKLMQLHSLVKIGLGGRINQLNQCLTLVFIAGVQVSMSVQKVCLFADQIIIDASGSAQCSSSPVDHILSESYLILLTFLSLALAISARHIQRNYNEVHCLLLASAMSIPVWILWVTLYMILKDAHLRDVSSAMKDVALATIVLTVIFGQKLYMLSKKSDVIKRKYPSSYADSVSTLFSHLNDFDTFSVGTISMADGSVSSRYSKKLQNQQLPSETDKSAKTVEINRKSITPKEAKENGITFNPLYESNTFKTFR